MRGAPFVLWIQVIALGIIPAYAGSTWVSASTPICTRDHPRVCGEHPNHSRKLFAQSGSSPRMRGAPCEPHVAYAPHGIIPAYAGSTLLRQERKEAERDHPRVCGEHRQPMPQQVFGTGSSPRMRGARGSTYMTRILIGIIPAYAGSTQSQACLLCFVCGSSPRMRGAPAEQVKQLDARGDHPRVCGEHA